MGVKCPNCQEPLLGWCRKGETRSCPECGCVFNEAGQILRIDEVEEPPIISQCPEMLQAVMKERPLDIQFVKQYNVLPLIERGDMIYQQSTTNVVVLDEIVGKGNHKTCRSIFDGFDIQNRTTLVYEDESYVEEYDSDKNSIFVKENIGLNSYYSEYYANSSSALNKLAQSIKPLNSPKEEIAKNFLELITQEVQPKVNLVVICREKLDDETPPSGKPYYKFLGSYKIDKVESLANGAITWRRETESIL